MTAPRSSRLAQALDTLERLGNRLPDPVTLFAAVAALIVACSHLFRGVTVRHPGTGASVAVESLASGAGVASMLTSAVSNFASYPPLATVLVVLMGVGVAERSGLVEATLSRFVQRVPPRFVTAALVFAGVNASLAADAGIVVLPPLGALIFARAGRPALAGLAAAFAGVSGGFSANLFVTSLDPLLAGITQSAARVVDATYEVAPTSNYYLMVVSTFMLTGVGTWVTERIVEPRLVARAAARGPKPSAPHAAEGHGEGHGEGGAEGGADAGPEAPGSSAAKVGAGLTRAGTAAVLYLAAVALLVVPAGAPLRDAQGQFKPFFDSVVVLTAGFFAVVGVAYGTVVGRIRSDRDVAAMAAATLGTMGGYLLVAFFAAQVIAWLGSSHLGLVLAVKGAAALQATALPRPALLIGFMVGCALLDFLVASASAKWALLAPVAVPMLMLLGVSPEGVQAAYRIADSTTNIVTPLMPYFPAILAFVRRHDPDAGVGTLSALMAPYALVFFVAWVALFGVFLAFDLPLGPGVTALLPAR